MSTTTITQPSGTTTLESSTSPYRGTVIGKLDFFGAPPDGSPAYNYVEGLNEPPEGVPFCNFTDLEYTVPISDMRGKESSFSLDEHGFLLVPSTPESRASKADFSSEEAVERTYYPEVEKFLLDNMPGAKRVYFFDITMRRDDPSAFRKPLRRVHIDQSASSAIKRVHHHLPEEAPELLKGRVRIANVWKPLNGPVESSPLALADSSTVSENDLVGVEIRYKDRSGENISVKHDENIKWYYWSGMDDDERILFLCYDSQTGSRAPHASFRDERRTAPKPRESIEVRALIFG